MKNPVNPQNFRSGTQSAPSAGAARTPSRGVVRGATIALRGIETPVVSQEIFALVVPRLGLESGELAARIYKSIEGKRYDSVIVVTSGNDRAAGRINIWSSDSYESGAGGLLVNDRLRNELCDEDDDIFVSSQGHHHDDGIRAQIPFLTAALSSFKIVPIVMGDEAPDFCRELGNALSEIAESERSLIVAVAEIDPVTEDSFRMLETYLTSADVTRLFSLIRSEQLRVVGSGPLMSTVIAASSRGTSRASLIDTRGAQNGAPGGIGVIFSR